MNIANSTGLDVLHIGHEWSHNLLHVPSVTKNFAQYVKISFFLRIMMFILNVSYCNVKTQGNQ